MTPEQFMAQMPTWVPQPVIVVDAPNCVGLDWDAARDRTLSVTLWADGSVSYSAIVLGHKGYGAVDDIALLVRLLGDMFPEERRRQEGR